MRRIPRRLLHMQQRETTCVQAALRTVLHRQFGMRIAEAALVALGTTPDDPIVGSGTDSATLQRIVRRASAAYNGGPPWTTWIRRHGTITMLRAALARDRWPIVTTFFPDRSGHHALVVVDIDDRRVKIFDPDPSAPPRLRTVTHEAFMRLWLDESDGCRWMAVISGGEVLPL